MPAGVYVCTFSKKNMARHIVCVLDRTVGHVSICWDYVSIFIYKNSNYNKINQVCGTDVKGKGFGRKEITIYVVLFYKYYGFNLDLYGDHN